MFTIGLVQQLRAVHVLFVYVLSSSIISTTVTPESTSPQGLTEDKVRFNVSVDSNISSSSMNGLASIQVVSPSTAPLGMTIVRGPDW